jgi:hypothetical protein
VKGWYGVLGLLPAIIVGLAEPIEGAISVNVGTWRYPFKVSELPTESEKFLVAQFRSIDAQPLIIETPAALTPSPNGLLPAYPSFNSQRLDQQLQIYSEYLSVFGTPDVLIVGSSRSLQGIDPIALQQALAEQGYPGLKIYNFGINGATAKVIDLLLRRILTPEQMPRLLIWADGSRAFNSARTDITYNGIVTSEGYRYLAAGIHPILPQTLSPSTLCSTPSSSGIEQILPFHDRNSSDSDMLYEPFSAAYVSNHTPALDCDSLTPAEDAAISVSPTTIALRPPVGADLTINGFQPLFDRFDPATYYRHHPRVLGRYDANYVPFRLGGEQSAATIAIADFARTQQIPLVFVNLPLTRDYLDGGRRTYEQQFRQHMQQLASQAGFIFSDLSQRWQTQNEYFVDPSHINQAGASAVARQLAIEPAIPWHLSQPPNRVSLP